MRSLTHLPPALLALILSLTHTTALTPGPGLKIKITNPTTCTHPTQNGDKISVHYRGTLQSSGKLFDESYARGKPITFTLGRGQVIKGWEQGLLDMCPGELRKLTIPPELAYGEFGSPPVIPGSATLVFDTELVEIIGVTQEEEDKPTETEDGAMSIATAPSTPPPGWHEQHDGPENSAEHEPADDDDQHTPVKVTQEEAGECHLLGPFALFVQGALGAMAVLALVLKRWREKPKRPWKIWFFDVSKQILGSMLLHILNLIMSMVGAMDVGHAAQKGLAANGGGADAGDERTPNPCSFYLLNLGIDTTIGIPILYLLLKIFHAAFLYTPLARPPQSIKSGHYDTPPRATWWLKQSLIYFLGLVGMKLCVLVLFAILPWLPWIGDWALRWTEGNEALEIAFVMFIFPLAMNALQYWIIDSLIKEKAAKGGKEEQGYERVQQHGDGDEEEEEEHLGSSDGSETVVVSGGSSRHKGSDGSRAVLREVEPEPLEEGRGTR